MEDDEFYDNRIYKYYSKLDFDLLKKELLIPTYTS